MKIDIIVPSYRMDTRYLMPILSIQKPDGCEANWIIVADNPNANIPSVLDKFIKDGVLRILINEKNLGAPESRNKGIELGNGDWVLFLDDDVVPDDDLLVNYVNAIKKEGNPTPGFVGVTRYPEPVNSFTKGVVASDILTFFSLAQKYREMSWGVTANLIISRNAIKSLRFSDDFPKFGGGEDIDICLSTTKKVGHKFKTLPTAVVHHLWWNKRRDAYKRFFRWAYGDSLLPKRFPEFRYHNFPNIVEAGLLAVVVGTLFNQLTSNSIAYTSMLMGIVLGDAIGEWIKLFMTKGETSLIIALESMVIRASNDLGRLIGNLLRWRITSPVPRTPLASASG